MPHIHTKPGQHDLTASAFIVRLDGNEQKILFHLHKKHAKLLHPGGHVELDENPWQAVLHEIEEETGYDRKQLKVLQPSWAPRKLTGAIALPHPVVINTHDIDGGAHKHTDISFAFVTSELPNHEPAEGESTHFRWLTKYELKDVPADEISSNAREMAMIVFDRCLPMWEQVDLREFAS